MRGSAPADLSGKRFGRLVAIRTVEYRNRSWIWLCKCDCGQESRTQACNLLAGQTNSCGCIKLRHGMADSPEYESWYKMRLRCNNPNHIGYENYGGRGLKVCGRWDRSFLAFFADMGNCPPGKNTIDRIDNNKGYSPANCRWATRKEQCRNKRNNLMIRVGRKKVCLAEAAEITGMEYGTLLYRITKAGWSHKRAISEPIRKRKSQ